MRQIDAGDPRETRIRSSGPGFDRQSSDSCLAAEGCRSYPGIHVGNHGAPEIPDRQRRFPVHSPHADLQFPSPAEMEPRNAVIRQSDRSSPGPRWERRAGHRHSCESEPPPGPNIHKRYWRKRFWAQPFQRSPGPTAPPLTRNRILLRFIGERKNIRGEETDDVGCASREG